MKYMVVTADYNMSGIKDEFEGIFERDDIDLPDEIWLELKSWVSEYQEITPMNQKHRKMAKEKIIDLDSWGISIKQKIIDHFKGDVKVKYYSEGLLKYIP